MEGSSLVSDPNNPPMPAILIEALKYMERQYPPASADGRFAINLPAGLLNRNYEFVARHVSAKATPLTPEAETSLPIYHIERVRIRGTDAQVEVVFPAPNLDASPEGGPVHQGVRLRMERAVSGWKVTSRREWSPGVAQPPPLNYWDPTAPR